MGDKRDWRGDQRSTVTGFSRLSCSTSTYNRYPGRRTEISSNIASISEGDYFNPGTIILADHFEEALETGSTLSIYDKSIIQVPGQKSICRKSRLLIIIAQHALTYVCVPLFTHNGNGTKFKPNPEEYISIQDHRSTEPLPFQSKHQPLVTSEMSGQLMKITTVAHIIYPVSRRYIQPMTVLGRLGAKSTNRLIDLFKKYMSAGTIESSPVPKPDTTIHAQVKIADTLRGSCLAHFAALFGNLVWDDAADMTSSELKAKGIGMGTDRVKLTTLLDLVETAREAGPDWKLKINQMSLEAV
jgi:hypothetical protein